MIYPREEHYKFLEEEIKSQTEDFKQKLETNARYLLEQRGEVFVAQYIKFQEGELILKFSTKRGLPRKGEYLYCFTLPRSLQNFRDWNNNTYGDLIKNKGYQTEAVLIWQSKGVDDNDFCIAGFRGINVEFAEHIKNAEGALVVLGPHVPPYDYIYNLQKILKDTSNEKVSDILDRDYVVGDSTIIPVNSNNSTDFFIGQLAISDRLIIQGPPGTGKTYRIAQLCKSLIDNGKSVLVTALTNRALIEVARKDALAEYCKEGRVHKTKLSVDEFKEAPGILPIKEIQPIVGHLVLSTFYITSSLAASNTCIESFDVVIMDEASQGLLAMFAAASKLGKKLIMVGDINQLPPVVSINEDRVFKRSYYPFIDGLKLLQSSSYAPVYTLVDTYRLPDRAAEYSGIFYNGMLHSANKEMVMNFPMPHSASGGPALYLTSLPMGIKNPPEVINMISNILEGIFSTPVKTEVAVLSFYVDTVKYLQKELSYRFGNRDNLLIETVSRIQGLTSDIVIYLIPNTGYNHSIERRLFNVATSRAKHHTIIISDPTLMHYRFMDPSVREFLNKLEVDGSVHLYNDPLCAHTIR